jgi:hypothetical protein
MKNIRTNEIILKGWFKVGWYRKDELNYQWYTCNFFILNCGRPILQPRTMPIPINHSSIIQVALENIMPV